MEMNRSSLIECLACGARGAMTWDGEDGGKRLISVAGEFHIETGRTKPDRKIIVCTQCDDIYGVLPADRPAF